MLVLGFIFMLPVLLIVMNSFKTGKEILTNFVSFPTSLYLDNFTRAMKTMRYASSFMNSAIITILTVIISLTVSFLAAYGILHLKENCHQVSTSFSFWVRLSFSCGYDCNYHYG